MYISHFTYLSTSSELGDSTSLYRVPGAAAWPGLAAAAGAKFKFKHQIQIQLSR